MTRARKKRGGTPASVLVCAMKGCDAVLNATNRSGVCHTHLHTVGVCECPVCRPRKINAGRDRTVPVTLPKPPWED